MRPPLASVTPGLARLAHSCLQGGLPSSSPGPAPPQPAARPRGAAASLFLPVGRPRASPALPSKARWPPPTPSSRASADPPIVHSAAYPAEGLVPAGHRGGRVGTVSSGAHHPLREAAGKLGESHRTRREAAENTTSPSKARPVGRQEAALSLPVFKRSRGPLDGPRYHSGQPRGVPSLGRVVWVTPRGHVSGGARGPNCRGSPKKLPDGRGSPTSVCALPPRGTCFARVWVKSAILRPSRGMPWDVRP